MQRLEMTITAKSWEAAKSILAEVGIDEKNKINYREVAGLYIVSVDKNSPLSESDYISIRDHEHISILSDSESRERIAEVLDKVYDVEIQLRKLLLHVSDLVETYFDILKNKYTKGYVDRRSISISGQLDPITSHLTLGQMKDILSYDISWEKRQLSATDLNDLIDDSKDFQAFKARLNSKLQEERIWDVIAINVLHTGHKWTDISGDLNKLKDFRDQSAHYQIITMEAKEKLIEKANHLLPMIEPPRRKLTKTEEKNLSVASEALASIAKNMKPFTAQYYSNLITGSPAFNSFKVNNNIASEFSKAIGQTNIDFQKFFAHNQAGLYSAYNAINSYPTWIINKDVDESEEDEDDDDDPSIEGAVVKK